MLPDFPKIKSQISEAFELFFTKRVEHYSYPIKNLPKTRIFEGTCTTVIRPSGEKVKTKLIKAETMIEIKYDEVGKLTVEDILNRYDRAAFNFAKQIVNSFYQSLSEILEEAGQSIDHKGTPFSAEIILKAFEKTLIVFDEKGMPEFPEIHIGPDLEEAMQQAWIDLNTEPDLKRRFEELIAKKREEWRAEQASRKLVG